MAGSSAGLSIAGHSPTAEGVDTGVTAPGALRLVLLGDSLAYGTGARTVEDAIGPRLTQLLEGLGFDVDLHVVAVPGATTGELAAQVRRAVSLQPDVALIVIGANDLTRLIPPAQSAGALASAVTALRAEGADVVVAPAPDLSDLSYVPPAVRAFVQHTCLRLQQQQAAATQSSGGTLAPISAELALAFAAEPALFSADRFHPSSSGYARIAQALSPFIVAAASSRMAALRTER